MFREVVEGAVEGDAMILIYFPLPPPPLFLIFPFFGHPIFQEKFSERERQ